MRFPVCRQGRHLTFENYKFKHMKYKFDNLKLGLILGIIIPFLSLILFYKIKYPSLSLLEFLRFIYLTGILTKILSLCVIPNLGAFFIFIKLDKLYSARGVLFSTIICAILVFAIKFIFKIFI